MSSTTDTHPVPSATEAQPTDATSSWNLSAAQGGLLSIGLLLLCLAVWFTWKLGAHTPSGSRVHAEPSTPVAASTALRGDMPIVLQALGTVTPLATVTVQSQIAGQIVNLPFQEGQLVKRGDSLVEIDARPYRVALEQAQGALERDRALLANARIDLKRYQTLYAQDSTSEQTLATQRALVTQYEGTIKGDLAQIDAAKLNLSYCHIVSPIEGRAGLQQVNIGNYVTSNEPNGLLVVVQLSPISVLFTTAEDQIPAIVSQLRAGKTLDVTAYNRDRTRKLGTGTLTSLDNEIDPTTGTVKLKATFANADESLFPDQFVNIDLLLDTVHGATLVPDAAIQRGAPGTYVYVVGPDRTVHVRKVVVGPADATRVSITQGLKPGESVVIDGVDRLRDGERVLVRPRTAT